MYDPADYVDYDDDNKKFPNLGTITSEPWEEYCDIEPDYYDE